MTITLTPEQQAALEEFDAAADAANNALQASRDSTAALTAAELQAEVDRQAVIATQVVALEKAQAFVDLMLPNRQTA